MAVVPTAILIGTALFAASVSYGYTARAHLQHKRKFFERLLEIEGWPSSDPRPGWDWPDHKVAAASIIHGDKALIETAQKFSLSNLLTDYFGWVYGAAFLWATPAIAVWGGDRLLALVYGIVAVVAVVGARWITTEKRLVWALAHRIANTDREYAATVLRSSSLMRPLLPIHELATRTGGDDTAMNILMKLRECRKRRGIRIAVAAIVVIIGTLWLLLGTAQK